MEDTEHAWSDSDENQFVSKFLIQEWVEKVMKPRLQVEDDSCAWVFDAETGEEQSFRFRIRTRKYGLDNKLTNWAVIRGCNITVNVELGFSACVRDVSHQINAGLLMLDERTHKGAVELIWRLASNPDTSLNFEGRFRPEETGLSRKNNSSAAEEMSFHSKSVVGMAQMVIDDTYRRRNSLEAMRDKLVEERAALKVNLMMVKFELDNHITLIEENAKTERLSKILETFEEGGNAALSKLPEVLQTLTQEYVKLKAAREGTKIKEDWNGWQTSLVILDDDNRPIQIVVKHGKTGDTLKFSEPEASGKLTLPEILDGVHLLLTVPEYDQAVDAFLATLVESVKANPKVLTKERKAQLMSGLGAILMGGK